MKNPKNILITGASSGIGAALTLEYAAANVTLFLMGRDEKRLNHIATRAQMNGAKALTHIGDVTDSAAFGAWINECDKIAPLDLVIANAGISAGTGGGEETSAQSAAILATNMQGVLNTVHPALALMKPRGRGQIALMSSMAAFRGVPGAPSYCASKAAMRVYGESLRCELAAQGVEINVICPGFVKTPMTDINDFPMPFVMEARRAAQIIRKGLEENKGRIAFPLRMVALIWALSALPASLTDLILSRVPWRKGGGGEKAKPTAL